MKVIKCDLCGKDIPDVASLFCLSFRKVNRLYNNQDIIIDKDLCGNCYDKIIGIFKDKDENESREFLRKKADDIREKLVGHLGNSEGEGVLL